MLFWYKHCELWSQAAMGFIFKFSPCSVWLWSDYIYRKHHLWLYQVKDKGHFWPCWRSLFSLSTYLQMMQCHNTYTKILFSYSVNSIYNYDFNYHLYMITPKVTSPSQTLVCALYLVIQLSVRLFVWRSKMATKSHHSHSLIYYLPCLSPQTCLCHFLPRRLTYHPLNCTKFATLSPSHWSPVKYSICWFYLSIYLLNLCGPLCLHLPQCHPSEPPSSPLCLL